LVIPYNIFLQKIVLLFTLILTGIILGITYKKVELFAIVWELIRKNGINWNYLRKKYELLGITLNYLELFEKKWKIIKIIQFWNFETDFFPVSDPSEIPPLPSRKYRFFCATGMHIGNLLFASKALPAYGDFTCAFRSWRRST
jgi:hypothetical protein